jgi:hypothetical protein
MSSNSSASASGPSGPSSLKDRLAKLTVALVAAGKIKDVYKMILEHLKKLRMSRYTQLVECIIVVHTPRADIMSPSKPAPTIIRTTAESLADKAIQNGVYDMGDDAGSAFSGASGNTEAGGINPNMFINAILRINPMIALIEKLISGAEVAYPDIKCMFLRKGPTARYFKSLLRRPNNQEIRAGLEAIVRFIMHVKTGKEYTYDLSTVKPAAPKKAR